ncbi:hypothetical protein DFQ07_0749 [Tenacibaculum caenipelagi]|uniref:Uncharacterized protein n=1 Tax=Tenacibaculum caenipelagi TaxID=1325435 RepID=A0A4R6TGY1_9FLAO|nr:hypothetical protein DFQ07_0749 [Tenacibaculum caenipelagi]
MKRQLLTKKGKELMKAFIVFLSDLGNGASHAIKN